MNEYKKGTGTYVTGTKDKEGNVMQTTERGFTFHEETGQELAFDIHDMEGVGTALLFGNQIFFLSYWSDEQLDRASDMFNEAISREKSKRNETS